MSNSRLVRFGIVGAGGYGGQMIRMFHRAKSAPGTLAELVAVCEPDVATHGEKLNELRKQGIQVFNDYDEFLRTDIEAVWLPLPIGLHRPFTEKALRAGKPVLCEKPAAGSIQDVDAMIAARDRAKLPVAISFQTLFDPVILEVKREILAGSIGTVREVSLVACVPRDDVYYARPWAARQQVNGAWFMDSPPMNALAHGLMMTLFLTGAGEADAAELLSVEAELYRARPIENYDTAAMRVKVAGKSEATLHAYFSHACEKSVGPTIRVIGDAGEVSFDLASEIRMTTPTGTRTWQREGGGAEHAMNGFSRMVRGLPAVGAIPTLEVARQHVLLINGVSAAAGIHDVPPSSWHPFTNSAGNRVAAINDIESIFDQCLAEKKLPHEIGNLPWTRPGGSLDLRGFHRFEGPRNLPAAG